MWRTGNGIRVLWLALALLALTACSADEPDQPTPTPVVESGQMPPVLPAATDTPLPPTPTAGPTARPVPVILPDLLPAALYFLQDGQIQRLESDGVTLTQMTQEADPITDFDVSPVDARLVYVSGNRLIESNPQYGTRIVKVDGGPLDADRAEDFIERRISTPHVAPDGSQIAFGLNGINLIPAGEATEFAALLASDPYPDPNNPPRSVVRFFAPGGWSPDGSHLLVNFSYWPEAGGIALFDLAGSALVEISSEDPNATLCCQWNWGNDGTTGYIASDQVIYSVPGLTRVDTSTGQAAPLVIGMPPTGPSAQNPLRLFKGVFAQTDGSLLSFISAAADFNQPAPFILHTVGADGAIAGRAEADGFPFLWEVLWARDGRGAVVRAGEEQPDAPSQVFWVSAQGESEELPVSGAALRWAPTMAPADRQAAAEMERADPPAASSEPASAGQPLPAADAPRLTALVPVNLRSGPGTLYPVVASLAPEESVAIVGVSPDHTWWQVAVPAQGETTAWVIGDANFVDAQDAGEVAVVTPPPPPAPAGRIFYPGRDPDGAPAIFVQELTPGAAPRLIVSNASQPDLSPDGARLAVRSVRSDILGIGVWDMAGQQMSGLTSHQEDTLPGWSPTSDGVVFGSTRHGDRRWRVYVQPANGDAVREIAFGLDPTWHPTADRIAYKGCDVTGENCGIWTMDSQGGSQQPVTSNKTDSRPVWSPGGQMIFFMSDSRDGNWEIYSVDTGGTVVTRLTSNPANDGLPVVSPDGRQLAFVSDRGGEWGVWVMPVVGGSPERLLRLGGELPNWLEQRIEWTQ